MTISIATAGTAAAPAVPASRSDSTSLALPTRPVLLWVRTGVAHVQLEDDDAFALGAGEGIWVPAGRHRRIRTEPGTVAFPLLSETGMSAPPDPTRFEVPGGWQDWLIQLFNLQVTPLNGRAYSPDSIIGILRRPGTKPTQPLDPPAMPRASSARSVAEELMRDPALDLTVDEWSSRMLTSPRTLRRDFVSGTGLTFEQWRLRCRLGAAVELLGSGYDVDQVAARTGFASRNGFTRAFKQQFGSTPREFGGRLAATRDADRVARRTAAARQADDLVRMVRGGGIADAAPESLRAAHTAVHANDNHVLSWIYRGSGYLDIDDRRLERGRGSATWIPAGAAHTTGIRENSISLPIGTVGTDALQLTGPLQVQFSPAWDDFLMFCAIASRSMLHPDDYDRTRILELFAEQFAAQQALAVPMPTDPRAREVALRCLRGLGSAADADVPADVHRVFRAQTGMTLARWRYAARMRLARDLLDGGAKPSAVARRIGYAHLPTFSGAFSRFHGMPPRDYQARSLDAQPQQNGRERL